MQASLLPKSILVDCGCDECTAPQSAMDRALHLALGLQREAAN